VWCGRATPPVLKKNGEPSKRQLRWHPECRDLNGLVKIPGAARIQVFLRDRGICAQTGEYWGPPSFRGFWVGKPELCFDLTDRETRDEGIDALCEAIGPWKHWGTRIYLGDFAVDHIIPLWTVEDLPDTERLEYFLLGNLQTLSPAAHSAKTAAEATQRAKVRRIRSRQGLAKPRQSKRARRLEAIQKWNDMP